MKIKIVSTLLTIAVLATLVIIRPIPGLAASSTSIYISVPPLVITNQEFTVDIVINPATAIAGAQFTLGYNPAYVTVASVAEGNLFTQNDNTSYFYEGITDNDGGSIRNVAGVVLGMGNSVSTPGTMAIITMTAGPNNGNVLLSLSNVIIGNTAAQAVPIAITNQALTINLWTAVFPPVTGIYPATLNTYTKTANYTNVTKIPAATLVINAQTEDAITGTLSIPAIDNANTISVSGYVSAYSTTGYMYLFLSGTDGTGELSVNLILRLWLVKHVTIGSVTGTLAGYDSASPQMLNTSFACKKQ
jgi:hypothetical protein